MQARRDRFSLAFKQECLIHTGARIKSVDYRNLPVRADRSREEERCVVHRDRMISEVLRLRLHCARINCDKSWGAITRRVIQSVTN